MPNINPAHIMAVKHEFSGIPAAHIRDGWVHLYKRVPLVAVSVIPACGTFRMDWSTSALPTSYEVTLTDAGLAACVTHLFAVYPSPDSMRPNPTPPHLAHRDRDRSKVTLFPTHGVVWAAHSSRLPRLSRGGELSPITTTPQADKRLGTPVCLPLVPISLPSPETFWAIQVYVYSLAQGLFVALLLPTRGRRFMGHRGELLDGALDILVQDLAAEYSLPELSTLANSVHGAYKNMVTLGMVADGLWEAVNFAWRGLVMAMYVVPTSSQS
ncbi:hypothetical protein C8Q76DRAFT_795966 [Earliella scabrosa]|nr:hypothetical protein C8Q76DRAFT_795966 [Earliella scabrosa]